MIVILAEKPDQAKKYGEVFDKVWYKEGNKKFSGFFKAKDSKLFNGQVVCITWAIGHLVELEEPEYYHEEWADKTRIDTVPLSTCFKKQIRLCGLEILTEKVVLFLT